MTAEDAIRLEGLTRRFGEKTAVEHLDLRVRQGEFFCFLGPNGAGKTTTIKLITGLLRPSGGRVTVGGHDVQQEPLAAKQLLGYVPDMPLLYEKLTGREFLRFVAGLYRMDEGYAAARAQELLATFDIAHVADQLVEQYSHGMRQKLSFAACFLHEPQVVVVDEPWVGLDPRNIRFVREYLKEQTRQGLTVFMSTHSLAIIEDVADRIGIIHNGRLLHLGSLEDILALSAAPGRLEDVFLELTQEEQVL
jgi:ABC-2 type transport system ATP-binding protein